MKISASTVATVALGAGLTLPARASLSHPASVNSPSHPINVARSAAALGKPHAFTFEEIDQASRERLQSAKAIWDKISPEIPAGARGPANEYLEKRTDELLRALGPNQRSSTTSSTADTSQARAVWQAAIALEEDVKAYVEYATNGAVKAQFSAQLESYTGTLSQGRINDLKVKVVGLEAAFQEGKLEGFREALEKLTFQMGASDALKYAHVAGLGGALLYVALRARSYRNSMDSHSDLPEIDIDALIKRAKNLSAGCREAVRQIGSNLYHARSTAMVHLSSPSARKARETAAREIFETKSEVNRLLTHPGKNGGDLLQAAKALEEKSKSLDADIRTAAHWKSRKAALEQQLENISKVYPRREISSRQAALDQMGESIATGRIVGLDARSRHFSAELDQLRTTKGFIRSIIGSVFAG